MDDLPPWGRQNFRAFPYTWTGGTRHVQLKEAIADHRDGPRSPVRISPECPPSSRKREGEA